MSPSQLFAFIHRNCGRWSVRLACHVLAVSESGYYRWAGRKPRTDRDALLWAEMKQVLAQSPENDNYGIDRMRLALLQRGVEASRSRVYRTMKHHGLIHKKARHPNGITRADAAAQKSENLLSRDFRSDAPGVKLLTDITEIRCCDGKLYLSAILDCFNGEIVGFSMADNMRAELCVSALRSMSKGFGYRNMIVHSDRGSQFTSDAYRKELAALNATQSMSGTGRCYDNARMESFFATLKKELIYRMNSERFPRAQVQSAVFRYIAGYYNLRRVYTPNPLGLPPALLRTAKSLAA